MKEKPAKRSGTLQEEGEDGPTDLGDARKSARVIHICLDYEQNSV